MQSWEQGERRPSQAALRLLQILQGRLDVICRITGVRSTRSCHKKTKANHQPPAR